MKYKFKVGDRVKITISGYGLGDDDLGKNVTITEIGEYGSVIADPGYKIEPKLGNTLSGTFDGFIGEVSFTKFNPIEDIIEIIDNLE